MLCTASCGSRRVLAELQSAGALRALEQVTRLRAWDPKEYAKTDAVLAISCIRRWIGYLTVPPSSGTVQCAMGVSPLAQRCERCGRSAQKDPEAAGSAQRGEEGGQEHGVAGTSGSADAGLSDAGHDKCSGCWAVRYCR